MMSKCILLKFTDYTDSAEPNIWLAEYSVAGFDYLKKVFYDILSDCEIDISELSQYYSFESIYTHVKLDSNIFFQNKKPLYINDGGDFYFEFVIHDMFTSGLSLSME